MTTDPGDLVFDPTCGSGTTAYVAEQWGRRWITCDTSRVALTLAKQRLMTAVFDYYELAHPEEGVGSGFKYKTVPHVTLKSIANNELPGHGNALRPAPGGPQEDACQRPVHGGGRARPGGQVGGGTAGRRAATRRPLHRPLRRDPAPGRMARRTACAPAFAARRASTSASPGWSRCPAAAVSTPTARPVPATKARIRCGRTARPTHLSASWSPSARSTPRWNSARWPRPSRRRRRWCPGRS